MRLALALAFVAFVALSGCARLADRLANGASIESNGEVIEPSGEVIEPNGRIAPSPYQATDEIIAAEGNMCLVRARYFKGLVRVPCDQIARTPAP